MSAATKLDGAVAGGAESALGSMALTVWDVLMPPGLPGGAFGGEEGGWEGRIGPHPFPPNPNSSISSCVMPWRPFKFELPHLPWRISPATPAAVSGELPSPILANGPRRIDPKNPPSGVVPSPIKVVAPEEAPSLNWSLRVSPSGSA